MATHTNPAPMAEAKEHTESLKDAGILESMPVDDYSVPRPAILADLSDDEIKAMEKKIVRKADWVMM